MNITLDKSLSVQLNVLLFSSINWLVSYRKLDTKRRLGSVVLECLFFCYVNVLIRQRTSSFSSEDHSFTDNASGRLLISTTGGLSRKGWFKHRNVPAGLGAVSYASFRFCSGA